MIHAGPRRFQAETVKHIELCCITPASFQTMEIENTLFLEEQSMSQIKWIKIIRMYVCASIRGFFL